MSALNRLPFNRVGKPYMPIQLKGVLMRHGIKQNAWCEAILQTNGYKLSLSAGAQIINWDMWPRNTPKHSIQKQTEDFLRSRGIDESEIATVWELDAEDSMRNAQPAGIHIGQYQRAEQVKRDNLDSLGETEMLSQNAKKHFKLFQDPFTNDVNKAEDIYLAEEQRYVRQSMFHIAKHGGMMAVVAESGGGKSVLRRDLIDRIQRENHPITVIFPRVVDKKRLTAGAICEAIIKDLNSEAKVPQSLESKARIVEKHLKASGQAGNSHVILIEEAHDLTIDTLKLLKRFWELEDGFRKLVSIILIGQPELKRKLDERSYPEAREFIRRCELVELLPLDRHLEAYLAFKFERLDKKADEIFTEDAFEAMRELLNRKRLGCYPLNVNNLVTKAMNLAAEIGEEKISAEVIQRI
jgi:type II secretory pathway predicted ATPase ExeA